MKYWLIIFSIFFLHLPFSHAAEDIIEISKDEELTTLDLSSIPNSSITSKELEIHPPVFTPTHKKSTFIAVSLSSLVPGLGHTYLKDLRTAGSILGSSGFLFSLIALNDSSESLQLSSIVTAQNTYFYNIFAAYRDTRIYNKNINNVPLDSFTDLSFAPFNLSILKKPEVWGGFLGALSLGIIVGNIAYRNISHIQCNFSSNELESLVALPIGIGEESFFRGYLQSTLYDTLSPWGAITVSSLIFGLAHIPNAKILAPEERWRYYSFSLPLITSLGAYFGWLTYKNQSLKESVAVHVWYDFTLFLMSSLLTQSAIKNKPRFAFSISF